VGRLYYLRKQLPSMLCIALVIGLPDSEYNVSPFSFQTPSSPLFARLHLL
jgi:hypothetical protein